ncbi:centromere/kinetochore protein zw10 homolog [Ctenocephalides felis]|uniref:centromere/kinetochore protein zw10 homolog n=1 Tax=Ctenocephalides felis TaxID=7515 RepID=UPI000E6E120A|nr:centromere/kinetochore protein zw10 homolog [Ctenocephalides felis]
MVANTSLLNRELQQLILDILQECGKAESAMLRQRLLCTACNVIRLYQSIVLVHHNNLINIPKQSALFHNNCMYLANWLLTISIQMQSYNITKEEIGITLYSDQISSLRLLGTKYLNQQMKQQKNIMINTLRDSDLNLLSQVTKLSKTNEAVSKCIEQINDLEPTGFKCYQTMFLPVCSAEDISAAVAADLVKYFDDVQKNALCMFKKHTDVMSRVQLWQKFQELKNVLKGNLESIESQWANGKGLLATVFEKQEIKHLIRALFQNTDRRAELLMKLK